MQPEQLAHMVQDLSLLHQVSAAELEAVVTKYPYFAMGHVLLLKKYQLTDPDQFNRYLPMAAIHVADRKRLHAFVEAEVPGPAVVETVDTSGVSDDQTAPASGADELLAYLQERKAEQTEPQKPEPEIIAPEEPIRDTNTEIPTVEESEPATVRQEETIEEGDLEAAKEKTEAQTTESIEEESETPTTAPETHTFNEWLQRYKNPEPIKPALSNSPLASDSLTDLSAAGEAFMAKELRVETKPTDALITGNNPLAPDEIEAVEGQAKKSVEMGDELVTETLAKIFLAQGNQAKALDTYEKLRLKYPEKSDYFAAQIAKLQENNS